MNPNDKERVISYLKWQNAKLLKRDQELQKKLNRLAGQSEPVIGDPSTTHVDLNQLVDEKLQEAKEDLDNQRNRKASPSKYDDTSTDGKTLPEYAYAIGGILALYAHKELCEPDYTLTQAQFDEATLLLADLRSNTHLSGCGEKLQMNTDHALATWIGNDNPDPFTLELEIIHCLAEYQLILIEEIGKN